MQKVQKHKIKKGDKLKKCEIPWCISWVKKLHQLKLSKKSIAVCGFHYQSWLGHEKMLEEKLKKQKAGEEMVEID